jgi:hypothetical protein
MLGNLQQQQREQQLRFESCKYMLVDGGLERYAVSYGNLHRQNTFPHAKMVTPFAVIIHSVRL